jgi:hypothetical protein
MPLGRPCNFFSFLIPGCRGRNEKMAVKSQFLIAKMTGIFSAGKKSLNQLNAMKAKNILLVIFLSAATTSFVLWANGSLLQRNYEAVY